MRKTFSIFFLTISFLGTFSQDTVKRAWDGEFMLAAKLAYHQQRAAYAEAGLFLGIESHLSAWGSGWIFGPAIGTELFLRTNAEARSSCIGPKVGFEFYNGDLMRLPWGARCNVVCYTNGKENSLKLSPEIGFSIWSFVNIFYGYTIPLTNGSFVNNNGSKFSLLINFPCYWKKYYK